MENLKKAVSKIIQTSMVVDKALEDKKVSIGEGMGIGLSAIGWMWIFRNFRAIVEDFNAMTEETVKLLIDDIKVELDLRNDVAEEVVEQALTIILNIAFVMFKTRPVVTTVTK